MTGKRVECKIPPANLNSDNCHLTFKMFLIGLTGNIASGKSTVANMLAEQGARVIDADELAHAALLRGRPAWYRVLSAFGAGVLRANAQIDRRKLGAQVFANPDKLRALESIVHPEIRKELALMLRDANDAVIVIEAVKLVEGGLRQLCDSLWVVLCDPDETRRRLIEERGMTKEEASARLASQPARGEKLNLADVVIDNSGSRQETFSQVARAWDKIPSMPVSDKSTLVAQLLGLTIPSTPRVEPTTKTPITPPQPQTLTTIAEPSPVTAPPPQPVVAPSAVAVQERVEETLPVGATISVHRAKRSDLNTLSVLIAKLEGQAEPLGQVETMQKLGKWSYWLALANDKPRGLVSWHAENLVGVIRDCWFERQGEAKQLAPPLFADIEQEARSLVNEVIILLLAPEWVEVIAPLATAQGFTQQTMDDLHKIWREVAKEHVRATDQIYVKKLREEMVTKPI